MADEENNMEEEPREEINEGEEEKKEEEPLLDSDGNPINPEDLKPKVPEAPLKLDLLRKSVKKLQRTYKWFKLCLYRNRFKRERDR